MHADLPPATTVEPWHTPGGSMPSFTPARRAAAAAGAGDAMLTAGARCQCRKCRRAWRRFRYTGSVISRGCSTGAGRY